MSNQNEVELYGQPKVLEHSDGNVTISRLSDDGQVLRETVREQNGLSNINQLGCFGNIWVRSHYFAKAGGTNGGGHKHHFDHVTMLAVGSVDVEVEGKGTKRFDAPTFIVIPKDHKHKFTALTDGVVYYCVFALRDEVGEVTDIYSGDNAPYSAVVEDEEEARNRLRELNAKTTHED